MLHFYSLNYNAFTTKTYQLIFICLFLQLIDESLNNFEKNISQNYNRFLTCVIMLKAASANNIAFIDNLSSRFVHVLQKVCRETPQSTNTESSMGMNELVIQSLDLMKNRVSNMHIETRKTFIGTILVGLIEKTNDTRIMKTILKVSIFIIVTNYYIK